MPPVGNFFYSYSRPRWRQISIARRGQNFQVLGSGLSWFGIYLFFVCLSVSVQDVRVYCEEVELDGKDAEQDYQQFKESCDSLAKLMSEIQELKANGAKEGVRAKCLTCIGLDVGCVFKAHNS